jgi:hypothetical protein
MTYRMQGVVRRSFAAGRSVGGFSTICETPQPFGDQHAIEWHRQHEPSKSLLKVYRHVSVQHMQLTVDSLHFTQHLVDHLVRHAMYL